MIPLTTAEAAARWLDTSAVADFLMVPVRRVQKLVKQGKLPRPSYHLGPRSPRWDREAIHSLLSGNQATEDAEIIVAGMISGIASCGKKNARRRNGQGVPVRPPQATGRSS
jgi:hypothetical protein